MGNKFSRYQKGIISFTYLAIGIFLLNGCTTTSTQKTAPEVAEAPVIESRTSSPKPVTSKAGEPADTITLSGGQGPSETGETSDLPHKPRIFFQPRPLDINQVLGIDFTMVDRGKSRLIVTTDKKVTYRLERKGPKNLMLTLEKSTIPPLLMRRLESIYFEGAVDRVKATITDKRVSLAIYLRDIVPYHVKQEADEITIDFGPTAIRPPEKRIVPLKFAQAKPQPQVQPGAQPQVQTQVQPQDQAQVQPQAQPQIQPQVQRPAVLKTPAQARDISIPVSTDYPGLLKTGYTGAPMTMDFVNADVTNILRLIAEVSNLNIVWGPEVKGNVSMRLKNVPWDQALDLILANNSLGKRRIGNVIWITTIGQLAKLEAEERRKRAEAEAERERRRAAEKKAKEAKRQLEPLMTDYLPVDFAKADEIKGHIALSDRGKLSVDTRTNTIVIKDIKSVIDEARFIVEKFDTPVKQVMIEARIVDATNTFTRDLGIRWGNVATGEEGINAQRRENTGVAFGLPTDATSYTSGSDKLIGGTFSTNSPDGWISNLGLSFGYLTSSSLGAITLDAQLALSETEGEVKIISAPKVIASNGESATINRGSTFYLEAAENVEPKEVNADLSLEVTPHISFNNFVSMEVVVKDEQETLRGKQGKNLTTKLMVKSGDTVVIGGIFKQDKTEDVSGIPWLKDVPGLGWLFKTQKNVDEKSELLIFLTPTVLPPPGQVL